MTVAFRPAAEADVRAIVDRYRTIRSALGDDFLDAVDEVIRRLVAFPRSAPMVDGLRPMRRARVRGFPHGVFFTVVEDEIIVLRVLHGARSERPNVDG